MPNLGLKEEIAKHLDTSIFQGDSPEDIQPVWGELYKSMRGQIAFVNAAFEKGTSIDPEVPAARRRERQRELILDAVAAFEFAMVEPVASLEKKLVGQEQDLLNSVNKQPSQDQTERIIQELRDQEIRRVISGAEKGRAAQMVFDAAKAGDKQVLDALEKSIFPIIGKDDLLKAREIFFNEHVPTLAQARERSQEMILQAKEKVNRVTRALKRSFDIPLSEKARKKQ